MRWLLLLGAEARYAGTLEAAHAQLAALGRLQVLTEPRQTRDTDGSGREYRNQLVSVACDASRSALVEACKAIERTVGRGVLDGVPLDIDLLACAPAHLWQRDAHADAKREFEAAHVRLLLQEAGLVRALSD